MKNQSTNKKNNKPESAGLTFERRFTKDNQSPYDQFTYEKRSSVIRNPTGDVVFEMKDVEVPEAWSQVATDILAQKYFRRTGVPQPDGTLGREQSVKQVVHRLADCWMQWGKKANYFASDKDAQIFYDEAVYMLLGQHAAPNSPQWFNTGLYSAYNIKGTGKGHWFVNPETGQLEETQSSYERPQPHACFILSVKDDLLNEGGIMDLLVREAKVFKYGSGVGTNFSALRAEGEKLSGGGQSSGLMSFLKILDRAAGAIKSGGTTRRAAKMVCLDLDHPEIESFINWKADEEKKVAALIAAGYPSDYEGEAYRTVSGQNSNNSVRIPNTFFKALENNGNWNLTARTDGHVMKTVPAQKLWDNIASAAWKCADPGVQFDTTVNEWHTCPEGGRINSSNPCSEYMFLDNTACNLASINLRKFYDDNTLMFDVDSFQYACRLWNVVLEISVLMAQFPSKEVAQLSYEYRTLGLGYANLGSLLMISGIPYDSDQARAVAASISAIMTGTAFKASAEMARVLGPFKQYEKNKEHMLRVIRNHRYAAYHADDAYENLEIKPEGIDAGTCPKYLMQAACKAWDDALLLGEKYGYRNAQVSAIAPTGTIGLLMDCDTTGVEPDFALVKFKKLSGGGYFKIVNDSIPVTLRNLGYTNTQTNDIVDYIKGTGSFKNAPYINHETLKAIGFIKSDIEKLEKAAMSAFDIRFLFNVFTLGEDCMQRIGINRNSYTSVDFNLLGEIGFTADQIEEANLFVCGRMTIEGAPHLKEEHLPIFDCANKCGKYGERFIHPHGHIRMMAAVQPFICGAISKTINLPNETTEKDIEECYMMGWQLGLKAISIYRDGSKFSQPLSASSKDKKSDSSSTEEAVDYEKLTADDVLNAAKRIIQLSPDTKFKQQLSNIVQRKKLPEKRDGFTQKAKVGGHTIFVRTGEYSDGTLGEVFIDMHKEGASFRSLLNCFAISVSIGLQYGVPLDEFAEKFIFTRFEPSGVVQHPNIKNATSVIDYIFRLLSFEYLGREDLVQVKPSEQPVTENVVVPEKTKAVKKQSVANVVGSEQEQFLGSMMGDAPVCNTCGHITIRSGSCYKCLNCGTSMGCS
ncbi:MAG: vitamin B12-dependent ribonucleotide reductase [Bacteroidetes bacterium]|jgi:ribonucleoside-diphosphate reductase alpha chain|nr:vitamin B12-dependent ribonucleotide reductase [Bacteroidota bacterium]